MKFGVVVFPGSNCDEDVFEVISGYLGMETIKLWHKNEDLKGLGPEDCIILPGGFSYGDYLRSGAIARFSPIMKSVVTFAENGGIVWGICNGFQILCEAGLLPGTLLRNENQKFICKNVYILPTSNQSLITAQLTPNVALKIPIAHADGRFFADHATLEAMKEKDQILFKYCNPAGQTDDYSNPNGSLEHIAGICNDTRNVFGMMPHPERAAHEMLGNKDGLKLFESLLKSSAAREIIL
jgi:phosphoribosylformylglycinamidine synthase